jgi:hypothetical protein
MLRTFFCSGLGFGARGKILIAVALENKISYDLMPYQLVKSNRRFGGAYFIFMVEQLLDDEDEGGTFFANVGNYLSIHTA